MIDPNVFIDRIIAVRAQNAEQLRQARQLAVHADELRASIDVDYRKQEAIYNTLTEPERYLLKELPVDVNTNFHILSRLLDTFYQMRLNNIYAPLLDKQAGASDPYLLNKMVSALGGEWLYSSAGHVHIDLLNDLNINREQATNLLSEYVAQNQLEKARILIQIGASADHLPAAALGDINSTSQFHHDEKQFKQQPASELASKDDPINKFYRSIREGNIDHLQGCLNNPDFSRHWGNALRLAIVERQQRVEDFILAHSEITDKITALDLSHASLADKDTDLIISILKKTPDLSNLNLADNNLDKAFNKINEAIEANNTITALNLSGNKKSGSGKIVQKITENQALFQQLNWAIERENFGEIHRLLDQGVSVNQANQQGLTPLMLAVLSGNVNLVKAILPHCQNFTARLHGETALDMTRHSEQTDTIAALIKESMQDFKSIGPDEYSIQDMKYADAATIKLTDDASISAREKSIIDADPALNVYYKKLCQQLTREFFAAQQLATNRFAYNDDWIESVVALIAPDMVARSFTWLNRIRSLRRDNTIAAIINDVPELINLVDNVARQLTLARQDEIATLADGSSLPFIQFLKKQYRRLISPEKTIALQEHALMDADKVLAQIAGGDLHKLLASTLNKQDFSRQEIIQGILRLVLDDKSFIYLPPIFADHMQLSDLADKRDLVTGNKEIENEFNRLAATFNVALEKLTMQAQRNSDEIDKLKQENVRLHEIIGDLHNEILHLQTKDHPQQRPQNPDAVLQAENKQLKEQLSRQGEAINMLQAQMQQVLVANNFKTFMQELRSSDAYKKLTGYTATTQEKQAIFDVFLPNFRNAQDINELTTYIGPGQDFKLNAQGELTAVKPYSDGSLRACSSKFKTYSFFSAGHSRADSIIKDLYKEIRSLAPSFGYALNQSAENDVTLAYS